MLASVSGPEQLRVRLLGGLEVEGIDGRVLGSRKARTLVKVLALARGAPVPADAVVEALWPGDDLPTKPVEQVGVLVSRLRSVLGPDRLPRSDVGWSLDMDWLDVVELEARVDEAAARLAAGALPAARGAARAALTLVRGELLADEPDPVWADADRARVARTVARARLIGAEAALAAGDRGDAATLAEGALEHDPYDEAALRVLMRAHAALGRPASALAVYARVRRRLTEELGVDPTVETEDLHTSILLGDPVIDSVMDRAGGSLRRSPMGIVGRDAELSLLDALLSRARDGETALVVIEGEAGIGKTTLVEAWSHGVEDEALVVRGQCDELGRDLSLQPILDGIQAHLRALDPSEVGRLLADTAPMVGPLLGRLSAGPDPAGPTTVSDPAAGRAALFASLLTTVERVAGDRPAVVIVEDAHVAGASTIEWLRFAVRRGRRLLVIATRRSEGPPVGPAEVIVLGPLDLASVTELYGAERAPQLHARSGGHPLFLHELATAASTDLPVTVREAVARRVDGLGPAGATLRAAAILGGEVDIDLLAGVLAIPVAAILEHLDAGMLAQVVEERSSTFAFRHELVRDALVAGTTAARRAFVHREAARVLAGRPGRDPMEVAWHARLGGDVSTAASALVDAAATAANRFDVGLADELLSDAISLEDSIAARGARARVRIARFDLNGAEADAARALELGAGPRSLELAGWAAYYKRNYELALQRAEEAVDRADDPGVRASALTLGGRILHASGHLPEADARLTEALAVATPEVRGVAQVFLGGLRVHQGQVDVGAHLVDRALLDPSRLGHPFALHHGHLFRVLALGMQGRPVDALAAVEAGSLAAREAGESGARFVAVQHNLRSWVLRHLGRLDEAEEWTQQALDLAGSHRASMNEMYYAARLDLLEGQIIARNLDRVDASVASISGLPGWHGTHAWHHHQRFLSLSAQHALAVDDRERASELAGAVVQDASDRQSLRYGLISRLTLARIRLATGEGIDEDEVDGVLRHLEGCAGLEAWRLTAEMAAVAGVDRWWRDAERRAGALVVAAGEHGEGLRRYVAATFVGLGR